MSGPRDEVFWETRGSTINPKAASRVKLIEQAINHVSTSTDIGFKLYLYAMMFWSSAEAHTHTLYHVYL